MNKILIVEDELDIQKLVHRILTANGFEVFKASNGEEGLIKATTLKPDLIVMDLMMPGMSGLEVCRLLKKRQDTKDIPVIILSALNRPVDREYASDAGADKYISKPFQIDELLVAIDTLMK
ncbi:response regulator [Candidatus Bathyarchaeota archaeon]|nr:response regulator [Candidatus Bathyarchaeota archaeon]